MSQEANRQLLEVDPAQTTFGIGDLAFYFLRLGTLGFGGPIALAGHMQKDLVDERHWFSNQDYLEGLAFSQLSPGTGNVLRHWRGRDRDHRAQRNQTCPHHSGQRLAALDDFRCSSHHDGLD